MESNLSQASARLSQEGLCEDPFKERIIAVRDPFKT